MPRLCYCALSPSFLVSLSRSDNNRWACYKEGVQYPFRERARARVNSLYSSSFTRGKKVRTVSRATRRRYVHWALTFCNRLLRNLYGPRVFHDAAALFAALPAELTRALDPHAAIQRGSLCDTACSVKIQQLKNHPRKIDIPSQIIDFCRNLITDEESWNLLVCSTGPFRCCSSSSISSCLPVFGVSTSAFL